MSRLTPVESQVLGRWGPFIAQAARDGLTVTDLVTAINAVARQSGKGLTPAENRAVSVQYGYSRREVNAGSALQAAQPGTYINSGMFSTPSYARDQAEQAAYPLYHVRFEYTFLDASGNIRTEYRTSVFPDTLPATIDELTAGVVDDANGMAAKYGHSLISAVPLNILVV